MTAVVLPGIPESVRAARSVVRAALGEACPAAEAAAVCVSELATNAIAYTRSGRPGGTFTVTVQAGPGAVCIRVRDEGGPGAPALATSAPGAEHGYGLRIVAAVAAEWGAVPSRRGTCTWCRITWHAPSPGPGRTAEKDDPGPGSTRMQMEATS